LVNANTITDKTNAVSVRAHVVLCICRAEVD